MDNRIEYNLVIFGMEHPISVNTLPYPEDAPSQSSGRRIKSEIISPFTFVQRKMVWKIRKVGPSWTAESPRLVNPQRHRW